MLMEMNKIEISKQILYCDDCFNIFPIIPDKSIDAIIADMPFGTTNCKWDVVLPLNDYIKVGKHFLSRNEYYLENFIHGFKKEDIDILWENNKKHGLWYYYERIVKDDGVILLFAQTPFDKVLGNSNLKLLRYEWIWEKTQATGHLNANDMPMKAHENILVFYKKLPLYNPIMTEGHVRKVSKAKNRAACIERRNNTDNIYNNEYSDRVNDYDSTQRYPRSVIKFKTDKQTSNLHKTQKPLALLEYLIKTYTNENDLILDNCMGSGTTNLASLKLNRRSIGIEKDEKIFNNAHNRLNNYISSNIVL